MNRVELLGTYGGDWAHALSAWTSTTRDLDDDKRARMPALLKQLADNGHETPFEKSALHFLVDCDVATHIHLIKHRIAVSINGESARYKELQQDRCYIPADWPLHLQELLRSHTERGQRIYHQVIDDLNEVGYSRKRAKESARYFLGYNNVTTVDVMFNFRSFIHFQRLRNDDHAQVEVRDIARGMLDLVRRVGGFEHSLEAFGYGEGV